MKIYLVWDTSSMMGNKVLLEVFKTRQAAKNYIKTDPLYGPYEIEVREVK